MTLALPDTSRTLTLRIASMFHRHAMNTNQIAHALSVPESMVWNHMGLARDIWRRQADV